MVNRDDVEEERRLFEEFTKAWSWFIDCLNMEHHKKMLELNNL